MEPLRSRPASDLHHDAADSARRRLFLWALGLIGLLIVAGAWLWSPLREFVDPRELGQALARLRSEPWAPLIVLGGFIGGGLLMVPVSIMVVLTVIAFGPVLGFVYALLASTASAGVGFLIGRCLGHRHVIRLSGTRIHQLSRGIGQYGFPTIAVLRMVPVAHFTVISMAAGTSHIRVAPFITGTVVGMAPGMIVLVVFLDRLATAARQPEPVSIVIPFALGIGLIAALLALRHRLRRRYSTGERVASGTAGHGDQKD